MGCMPVALLSPYGTHGCCRSRGAHPRELVHVAEKVQQKTQLTVITANAGKRSVVCTRKFDKARVRSS